MAMQDGWISLGTPSDVDMDDLRDISSDFRTGILFFPDYENDSGKRTEARLRAAFAKSPTSTISDLFNYAAQHGLPFRIMTPLPPRINNGALFLDVIGHGSVGSWRAAVEMLLQRPHTRAFVLSGGLEGMIARWIGGEDLIQRVMQGPALTGPHVKIFTCQRPGVLRRHDNRSRTRHPPRSWATTRTSDIRTFLMAYLSHTFVLCPWLCIWDRGLEHQM
jgi:hypothetical protein